MTKVIYIGRFTPATGGVTAKNTAIFNEISSIIPVEKIDLTFLKSGKATTIFQLLKGLFGRNQKIILGTSDKARRFFSMLLYIFNRKVLNDAVLMIMGGGFGKQINGDQRYHKWLKEYKMIYVETETMKAQLKEYGIDNVSVFPNCRKKPDSEITIKQRNGKLKCVCFSMIYPEKGIDLALQAAKQLPDINFDFWGGVREDYKQEFFSEIDALKNCKYNGVFKTEENDVYQMLNKYDVFLFPTRHKNEGVPGALLEAKMAGLPAIASDFAYNSELVEDKISGLLMKNYTVESLIDAIVAVDSNDELLMKLKTGAKESGKKYYFDEYIDHLIKILK